MEHEHLGFEESMGREYSRFVFLTSLSAAIATLMCAASAVGQSFDIGKADYDRGEYLKALVQLGPLAEKGNADAQVLLGDLYSSGDLGFEDPTTAFKWYLQAAEQGNAKAEFQVGLAFMAGHGVPLNQQKEFYWFSKAAEQGNYTAGVFVCNDYLRDKGRPENPATMAKWVTKAVDQAFPDDRYFFQACLARMYEKGDGVPGDYSAAATLYEKAVAHNQAMAEFRLAFLYFGGEGVKQDSIRAYLLLQAASRTCDSNPKLCDQDVAKLAGIERDFVGGTMTRDQLRLAKEWAAAGYLAEP